MSTYLTAASMPGHLVAQATFEGPDVDWFALSPLIVLVGAALALLLLGALTPTWPRGLYAWVTVAAAIAAGGLAMANWDDITDGTPKTLVDGALAFDTFSMFVTIAVCVALIGVALITSDHLRRINLPGPSLDGPEHYGLFLIAGAGGVVMGAANDLIVLFLGLETLSLAFYVLAASNRRKAKSQESGMKYFILGGFSSAFFLYGIAMIYGATGTTNISKMVAAFDNTIPIDRNEAFLLAGVALLVVGFGFKVAAAPFHVWTPDVYEGAPTPITALMASVGKIGAFAALLRVLVVGLGYYRDDWRPVIWVLAIASLVVGSVLAVVQTNVKRMLAYSSISHAGFMLVGLEAAGHRAGEADSGAGVPAVLVYLIAYAVLVVGTFGVVALVARRGDDRTDLDSFRGLGKRQPALALALTVFLVAQAGVPFTSGFIAKFGVISAAVDEESYALAIIAMLASVIAAFLYLRIMVSAWIVDAPDDDGAEPVTVPFRSGLAIAAAAAFTLVVGIVPGWLLDAADVTIAFAR
jgi:NADH-quinone oxidoreductase subunit N